MLNPMKIGWILMFACVVMLAAPGEGLLFRHSFEQGIKADFAAGNPTPEFLGKEEQLTFGAGLQGKGFVTGSKGQALRFRADKNWPEETGTVMFWMSAFPGEKWQQNDRKFYIFLEFFGKGGWVRLYKYHQYAHVFLLSEVQQGEKKLNGRVDLPNSAYQEDNWNLYAFTWNRNGRVSFYINGILVGSSENFPLPAMHAGAFFQIGQAWGENPSENRTMDNLQIFDRALSNYEIMACYRQEGEYRYPQQVTIGSTAIEPTLDGTIDEAEWQAATMIPLLTETAQVAKVSDTVSYLRLMYGEKDLFLAFHSPIPEAALADPHGKLLYGFFRRNVLKHDENVDHDDALDIHLLKPKADGSDFYRLAVNTIDTAYDYVIRSDRTLELQWQPGWTVKSDVSEEGWKLEARIPFAGLECAPPQPGERWQMNFHRIWKQLKNQQDSWSLGRRDPGQAKLHPYPFGEIGFAGADHVALNKLRLHGLHKMQPELDFELFNQGGQPRQLQLRLESENEVFLSEEMTLAGGEKRPFSWKKNLSEHFPAEFSLVLRDSQTQAVLYRQQLPLWAERFVEVRLRSYPSSGKIRLEGDVSALDLPASAIQAHLTLRQNDRVAGEYSFFPAAAFFEYEVDTSALPTGNYELLICFNHGEKELAASQLTWEKHPLPEWFGNNYGISDKVPAPWTPVRLLPEGMTLQCWGREYHFGEQMFLTQITSNGTGLLAAPATILLQRGAESIDLNRLPCQRTIGEQNESRVRWQSRTALPGLELILDQFLEFDGFLWTELQVNVQGEPVAVDRLQVSLPLRADLMTLINPYDYSLMRTGYLPEAGWSGEIRPLWLGNEALGLQWVAETSHNWQVQKRQQELEVRRQDNQVILTVNLINKATTLQGSSRYAFGLQATPVKPMHPDHRRWRIGSPEHIAALTPETNIEFIAAWSTSWADPSRSSGEVYYPNPKPSLTKKSFAGAAGGRPWSAYPYYQLHETWTESPEFRQFGDEWLKDLKNRPLAKSGSKVSDRQIPVCQGARSHQDFILAGYERLQRQASPRGYYYDMSQPGGCNNVYHGCGYQDAYGQYHATFNVLGNRELVKRIYIHLKQHRPDGMILYHNSGQLALAVHSFADLLLDGENTYSRLDRKENRGYEKFLTLDTYRAQYMGHNFGPAVGLLPQFTRAGSIRREEAAEIGPRHAEYVLGLVLLHDSQLWIAYFYDNQPLITLYSALEKHDFATGGYAFSPYWKQKITPALPENQAVASFYVDRDKQKALMVLMNMSGADQDFALRLDPAALGFQPKTAANACHAEPVLLQEGEVRISGLPSHTYRLLVLE